MATWRRKVFAGVVGVGLVVACGGGENGAEIDLAEWTETQSADSSVSTTSEPEEPIPTTSSEGPVASEPTSPPDAVQTEFADGLSLVELYTYGGELEHIAIIEGLFRADDVPIAAVYEGEFAAEAEHNSGSLNVIACDDDTCATTSGSERRVDDLGWGLSAALSPDGLPVLAYVQNYWDSESGQQRAWATLLACDGPACTTAIEIEFANVLSQSLAVAPDGRTYVLGAPPWAEDAPAPEGLPLMICDEPSCADGPRLVTLDVEQPAIGAEIAVSETGPPFIAMSSGTDVTAVSCLDPECAQVEEWVAFAAPGDDGFWTTFPQVAAGPDGPSTIAFEREPGDPRQPFFGPTLVVWDQDPTTAKRIDLDEGARLGPGPSVAVGVDAKPAVAWMRLGPDAQPGEVELMLARCDDRSCTTGTTATLARNLRYTEAVSVAIGTDGNPSMLFVDENQDPPALVLARCQDPACAQGSLDIQAWAAR